MYLIDKNAKTAMDYSFELRRRISLALQFHRAESNFDLKSTFLKI